MKTSYFQKIYNIYNIYKEEGKAFLSKEENTDLKSQNLQKLITIKVLQNSSINIRAAKAFALI